MTDLQAAVGRPQLARLPAIIAERRALAARYTEALADHPLLAPPTEPAWLRSNWQSYPTTLRTSGACRRSRSCSSCSTAAWPAGAVSATPTANPPTAMRLVLWSRTLRIPQPTRPPLLAPAGLGTRPRLHHPAAPVPRHVARGAGLRRGHPARLAGVTGVRSRVPAEADLCSGLEIFCTIGHVRLP